MKTSGKSAIRHRKLVVAGQVIEVNRTRTNEWPRILFIIIIWFASKMKRSKLREKHLNLASASRYEWNPSNGNGSIVRNRKMTLSCVFGYSPASDCFVFVLLKRFFHLHLSKRWRSQKFVHHCRSTQTWRMKTKSIDSSEID